MNYNWLQNSINIDIQLRKTSMLLARWAKTNGYSEDLQQNVRDARWCNHCIIRKKQEIRSLQKTMF